MFVPAFSPKKLAIMSTLNDYVVNMTKDDASIIVLGLNIQKVYGFGVMDG